MRARSLRSVEQAELVVNGDAAASSALSRIGIGAWLAVHHVPISRVASCAPSNVLSCLRRYRAGENAPKPANLLAVPIQRRPLFPGFMAPLVVTDEALVEAMIALKKTPSPFVGVFLVNDPNVGCARPLTRGRRARGSSFGRPAPRAPLDHSRRTQIDLTVDKFQLTRLDQIHRTGTLAHIQQLEAGPGGAIAMLMAHRRCVEAVWGGGGSMALLASARSRVCVRHCPPVLPKGRHQGRHDDQDAAARCARVTHFAAAAGPSQYWCAPLFA